jgi:hypothetical protein
MNKISKPRFNVTKLKLKKDSNGKKGPATTHMMRGTHSKAMTAKMKKAGC